MSDETKLPLDEGAVYLLVDRAGSVLLQRRDDDVPPAGYGRWGLPGGHVEPGETPLEAAFRELEEETGLSVTTLEAFGVFEGPPGLSPLPVRLHVFASGDEVDPAAISVNEGLDFRFQPLTAIPGLAMNPFPRGVLSAFLTSPLYSRLRDGASRPRVVVLALDRWGRVLLQRNREGTLSLPTGTCEPGEPPDAAALRLFEAVSGHLLEDLQLWRAEGGAAQAAAHVYYHDPDLPLPDEGGFGYVGPHDLERESLNAGAGLLLEQFFASPAYRALFH